MQGKTFSQNPNDFHTAALNKQHTPESLAQLEKRLKENPAGINVLAPRPSVPSIWSRSSDSIKYTPIQLAILEDNEAIIRLYLPYADLTIEGTYGSALHYAAAYSKHCGTWVIHEIINRAPELTSKPFTDPNRITSTPLHSAATHDESGEAVKALLEHNADIEAIQQPSMWTPLCQAVNLNNKNAVIHLLNAGADKSKITLLRGQHYWSGECVFTYDHLTFRDKRIPNPDKAREDAKHAELLQLIAEFSNPPAAANSKSRKLPSNQVATKLDLRP